MIRSKTIGKRYLAGFVVAAALVHLAAIVLATYIGWANGGGTALLAFLLLIGFVPATGALFLARMAWRTQNETSAAYSSAGLVVLLMALIASHFGRFAH